MNETIPAWQVLIFIIISYLSGLAYGYEKRKRLSLQLWVLNDRFKDLVESKDNLQYKIDELEEKLNDFDKQVQPTDRDS